MRQQIIYPPAPPRPSPRVEVVDDRGRVWLSVREHGGKFIADGHAVNLLYHCPFTDVPLTSRTLEEAVVEARQLVAGELYRRAGEMDAPSLRPAGEGAVLPDGAFLPQPAADAA